MRNGPRTIGYYVHHHGGGHLARARAVAAQCDLPITVLSSLPEQRGGPFVDWVTLPRDDDLDDPRDVTAGGALHWVPLDSPGLRARAAAITSWAVHSGATAIVSDVSVEVALLARLCGLRTIVMAQPGHRDDPAHALVYRTATTVLAPWPAGLLELPHLAGRDVVHTGAFSGSDDRVRVLPPGASRVLVLLGSGGSELTSEGVAAMAAACPDWHVRVLGGGFSSTTDVWSALMDADVVVTHAGLNAVAEVAAARRPAVVVAQQRPFGEQQSTAAALDGAGIAVGLPAWPAADRWPDLLTAALTRGGAGWARWSDGHGAARAAAALADTVRDAPEVADHRHD